MDYTSQETNIVVCDDKGLGIELIDHLVHRGARKFLVCIKPNSLRGYFYTKSMSWKKQGVFLQTFSDIINTEKGCMALLSQASKLGPIHGIFVVQNVDDDDTDSFKSEDVAKKFNDTAMVVANLDLMSRNVCGDLKYFVVLSRATKKVTDEYNISVSEKICQIRNDVGLPALFYRVGLLDEFNKNPTDSESSSQRLSYSAVFSALETSLKLNYKNVQAFNLRKRPDDEFVRKIEKILGIKNINDLSEDLTLENLSLSEMSRDEIIKAISDTYNLSYAVDKLNDLTISSIKNLSSSMKGQKTNFDGGLSVFYDYIDDDECNADEPMVAMPTRLNTEIEREDEIDSKAEYLMLIPGFEGHHRIFSTLSERLKLQAMTFQLGPNMENDSILEMAAKILKVAKARFESRSKFYLLGYSFGVNVAIELAGLLEKEGHVGTVFCLDSSPDSLRVQFDAYVGNLSDTQLQNAIIEHLYQLMTGEEMKELKKELEAIDDWTGKKERCVIELRGLVKYSHQYKRSLLQSAYNKIIMAREYEPKFKLESEIVLIKGIPHPNAAELPDDYNLSKYTNRPVKIFNIDADHALAPFDIRVTNFVNRMLEPALLEEYKKKNLCEVYYTDTTKTF